MYFGVADVIVVCGVQFSNHVVGVSLLFSSPECHDIVETPQKVTGALRFQKRHLSSPEDVRLCYPSFGEPVCCDAFVSPMAWNCGRLATATSIFCSIADAFVTRCRLFVIRDNDASNFANWCSWSFVCEGVASATTSASILLGKRKKVDLRLLVSIGCMGCSAVPQSGICFAWKYGIRISQVIVFLLRFMLFYFVCERS